jgi:RimJ/RimL family protein N-acetyltransferase
MQAQSGRSLRTDRLVLRPTEAGDAQRFVEIQSDWNVVRMLRLAPWPPSIDAMRAWVEEHDAERRAGTAFRFAIVCDGRVIGCCDVDEIADGGGDLGYWLERPAWGHGYAQEAARAVIDFAFEDLGLAELTAGHAAENTASGRVLERLGFAHVRDGHRPSRPRGGEIVPYRFLRLVRS